MTKKQSASGALVLEQAISISQRIILALHAGTIRTRLPIFFVLMVLLPAVLIITTSILGGLQGGRQQVSNQLESVATLKEAEINTWLQSLQVDLTYELGSDTAGQHIRTLLLASPDSADFQAAYSEQTNRFQQAIGLRQKFEELSLMDLQGQVILSTDATQKDKFYSNQTYFKRGLEGPYMNPPSFSTTLGRVVVIAIRPVTDQEGKVLGVLAGRASMATLSEIMRERTGLGTTGETYLVGSNRALLTELRSGEKDIYVRTQGANAAIDNRADGFAEYANYRNMPVLGVYHWLPELQVALLAEQGQSEALNTTYSTANFNVVVAVIAVFIAVIGSLFITRSITSPLANLTETATQITTGNLDLVAKAVQKDEIGVLAQAFNNMTTRLREMLRTEQEQRERLQTTVQEYVDYMTQVARGNLATRLKLDGDGRGADDPLIVLGHQLNDTTASLQRMIVQVHNAASNLAAASAEILAATTQQASGASEQSAAISQTTTTVDEVKTIAEQASVRAQEVAGASQRTVEVSRSGQKAVQDTIGSMEQIKERVEGIAENILALSEQTQQIGEIIASVNDIASQSNILALNASIEAARAGEHGKGFAVVAVEVRNLAEQSKQATTQVKTILSEIQRATNATVMATEEGTKRVDAGVALVAQTRQAIEQLSGVINESAQAATQMVAGGRQQVSGVDQIALAMRNINQATVQSLASTRQAEKSAQNLNELARSLTATVTQYRL